MLVIVQIGTFERKKFFAYLEAICFFYDTFSFKFLLQNFFKRFLNYFQ